MIPIFCLILTFLAVFFLTVVIGSVRINIPVSQFIGEAAEKRKELERNYLYNTFAPLINFLAYLSSKMPWRGYRQSMDRLLSRAGYPGGFLSDEFMAIKTILALSFFILGEFLSYLIFQEVIHLAGIILFLLSFFYPDIWLSDQIKRRKALLQKEIPYHLDLITISVQAGLDIISSFNRIFQTSREKSPFAEELGYLLQEVKMGVSRRDALRNMADRIDLEDLTMVITSIIQAEEMGTNIGGVLRVQSDFFQFKRAQRAEKQAMQAPVKMLFPMLLIFSCVFLVLFGPIVVRFLEGEMF